MAKRLVEIFVAGCPVCEEAVELVRELACDNCDVRIYDLSKGCPSQECRHKAADYGIKRLPSVVVDTRLVDCCQDQRHVSREALTAAGIGRSRA